MVFMEKQVMNYWTLGITFFHKALRSQNGRSLSYNGLVPLCQWNPKVFHASSSLGQWNSVGQGIWRIWTEKVSEIWNFFIWSMSLDSCSTLQEASGQEVKSVIHTGSILDLIDHLSEHRRSIGSPSLIHTQVGAQALRTLVALGWRSHGYTPEVLIFYFGDLWCLPVCQLPDLTTGLHFSRRLYTDWLYTIQIDLTHCIDIELRMTIPILCLVMLQAHSSKCDWRIGSANCVQQLPIGQDHTKLLPVSVQLKCKLATRFQGKVTPAFHQTRHFLPI